MAKRKLKTGEWGWLGLLAYIIIVDSIAWRNQAQGKDDETMSLSWGRWLQFPGSRAATGAAWALITGHLFLSMPLPGGRSLKKLVTMRNGKKIIIVRRSVGQHRSDLPRPSRTNSIGQFYVRTYKQRKAENHG